jgi:cytoskeletal protein CcmA (bactofilin family)
MSFFNFFKKTTPPKLQLLAETSSKPVVNQTQQVANAAPASPSSSLATQSPTVANDQTVSDSMAVVSNSTQKQVAETSKQAPFKITSLIAKTMRMDGNLTLHEGLKVEGVINGNVEIIGDENTLLVSAGARIEGEIKVNRAIVAGTIVGNLIANQVILFKTGRVDGDIFYDVLKMEDGGEINGKMAKNKDYAEIQEHATN